jgi:hypothetical protein
LVTEGGILKFAREAIDNDKILIYERWLSNIKQLYW